MNKHKDYLGDGVYVAFDGYHLVLTTEDGISVTNTIYLEPPIIDALQRYRERLAAHYKAELQAHLDEAEGP